mmetsp:Transcript_51714/g.143189  ORF Transcript_51714/g.143189 Transcript_51714/m.143189 type:complete len:282 (-) Transcript_51714:651-1496(-)|eukprot:163969-Prymnesium_polylepis.3
MGASSNTPLSKEPCSRSACSHGGTDAASIVHVALRSAVPPMRSVSVYEAFAGLTSSKTTSWTFRAARPTAAALRGVVQPAVYGASAGEGSCWLVAGLLGCSQRHTGDVGTRTPAGPPSEGGGAAAAGMRTDASEQTASTPHMPGAAHEGKSAASTSAPTSASISTATSQPAGIAKCTPRNASEPLLPPRSAGTPAADAPLQLGTTVMSAPRTSAAGCTSRAAAPTADVQLESVTLASVRAPPACTAMAPAETLKTCIPRVPVTWQSVSRVLLTLACPPPAT